RDPQLVEHAIQLPARHRNPLPTPILERLRGPVNLNKGHQTPANTTTKMRIFPHIAERMRKQFGGRKGASGLAEKASSDPTAARRGGERRRWAAADSATEQGRDPFRREPCESCC